MLCLTLGPRGLAHVYEQHQLSPNNNYQYITREKVMRIAKMFVN